MSEPDPKPVHQYRLWEFQAVRDALVIVLLIGAIWLGGKLSLVTVPLLIGLGIAYIIEPVVSRLATWRFMTRLRAVLLIVVLAIAVVAGLLAVTIPPLVRQGMALASNADGYATRAHAWVSDPARPAWLRERAKDFDAVLDRAGLLKGAKKPAVEEGQSNGTAPSTAVAAPAGLDEARVRALIREEMGSSRGPDDRSSLAGQVLSVAKAVGSGIATVAGGFFTVAISIGIAAVATVSFSIAWPAVLATARDLIPSAHRDHVLDLVGRMDRTVSSFVRGRITVAAIVGSLYAIGWTLVGVPYGLVLGLVVGVLSLVPYLAAVGLPAAWLLLALDLIAHPSPGSWYLTADPGTSASIIWWKLLLFPAIVNFVVQQTEDYVLNPLIQGKATELHPAAIMVVVIAGGSLAGLYGMLLAVPVAACGKILLTAELLPRFKRWASRPDSGAP